MEYSERTLWVWIILSLFTVFPLLVYMIPTPEITLISKEEYLFLNFEIFLRIKVYLAIFIAGMFSGIIGADLRYYKGIFVSESSEETGWAYVLLLDLFIVSLILSFLYSLLGFIRIVVDDYDNGIIEFIRFMDLGYPMFLFLGIYVSGKIRRRSK